MNILKIFRNYCGDSGLVTPGLYKQCEENGTGYVIRLKENAILRDKASYLVDELIIKYPERHYKANALSTCQNISICYARTNIFLF